MHLATTEDHGDAMVPCSTPAFPPPPNPGVKAPLLHLSFLLLVVSCQCQCSGSLEGPDGCGTRSSHPSFLSPAIHSYSVCLENTPTPPSRPPTRTHTLRVPYYRFHLHYLCLHSSVSHGAAEGHTPGCPRLRCQDFSSAQIPMPDGCVSPATSPGK